MNAGTTSSVLVPMPRLSDSMEEGTVVRWLVADGATVERGQEIAEIETDKATMGFEAPVAGPLRILVEADASVAVGEPIARIGEGEDPPAEAASPAAAETSAGADPAPPAAAEQRDGIRISPVARRLAAERGVDLAAITGSGPGGRILKSDVLKAGEGAPQAPATGSAGGEVTGSRGGSRRQAATRSQQVVARRMSESRATVPEFSTLIEVEMTAALEMRRQLKEALDAAPSLNDIVTAALARTLTAHPRLNASYADGEFEFFDEVNVGIAVAVEDELRVPVLSGADRLTLSEVASQTRRLVERTRSGQVTPPELAGGTFTISNLGMFGISSFQPIINLPQAAILGVGGVRQAQGGQPATLTLNLVSDHRIVYGSHAAVFLSDLRETLEQPIRLLAG